MLPQHQAKEDVKRWLEPAGFSIEPIMLSRLQRYYQKQRKLILVLSHTSTHDFFLGLLLFGCLDLPFTIFTSFHDPILRYLSNCMKPTILTKSQEENKSSTDQIIDFLKSREEFVFLIALSPTSDSARIHSGYYYIAQALQADIAVIGWDYMLRKGYVSSQSWKTSLTGSYAEFQLREEQEMLTEIKQIYPLKPDFQVGFYSSAYHMSGFLEAVPTAPNLAYLCLLTAEHRGWLSFVTMGLVALVLIGVICAQMRRWTLRTR